VVDLAVVPSQFIGERSVKRNQKRNSRSEGNFMPLKKPLIWISYQRKFCDKKKKKKKGASCWGLLL
jgi:hypothetical protein